MDAATILGALDAVSEKTVPLLRLLRKQFSKELAPAKPETLFTLARNLIENGDEPARFVAYELIYFHKAARAALDARRVVALGKGMASWAAVDTFAYYVSGPAWKAGLLSDADIMKWARSDDLWWRRAALVSTVNLNRRPPARDHVARTLAVCETAVDDREDMVVKALSWALRELSRADRSAAESFLEKRRDDLAPRVVRELTNKLRTGLKTPRKATA